MWYICDNGKQKSTGISVSEDESGERARDALKDYLVAKRTGQLDVKPASTIETITVDAVLDLAFRLRIEHAKAIAKRRNHVPKLAEGKTPRALRAFWAGKTLSQITELSCKQYVNFRTNPAPPDRDMSVPNLDLVDTAQVWSELKALRAAILAYVRMHDLPIDRRVYLPAVAREATDWFTQDELERLLLSCDGQTWDPQSDDWVRGPDGEPIVNSWKASVRRGVRRFILIGAFTGTRKSAMLRLRWHRSSETGYVDDELRVLHRKGDLEPGTDKMQTPCLIPRNLQNLLETWKKEDSKSDFVHVIHHFGLPYEASLYSTFKSVLRDAGMGDRPLKPHSLRHTCAHWLKDKGVPIWVAADYLGMSVRTLSTIYGAHSLDCHEIVLAAFDQMSGTFGTAPAATRRSRRPRSRA